MIRTLNKHIKWRRDKKDILICDCKRLIDLKLSLRYKSFMEKLDKGIEKDNFIEEEKKVFSDFEKMKLLSNLKIRPIKLKEFDYAIKILDDELGKDRGIKKDILSQKFKKFPEFFIGTFLDNEMVGVICGFPRQDYLLISKIAIAPIFQNRSFGKRLMEKFEEAAKGKYNKINVGARDSSVYFYKSLLGYKPFLCIQFKVGDYSKKDFDDFHIIKEYNFDSKNLVIETEINGSDLKLLDKLRKKYPKVWFQYIFTKRLNK